MVNEFILPFRMGSAELDTLQQTLTIHSHIITYGNEANEAITEMVRDEIETMWNEPNAIVHYQHSDWLLHFMITAYYHPDIQPEEILTNTDPRNNYFRIEKFALTNISFVDGLGCNTGYFLLENLYKGSTTAAHEYGHTLGLAHPEKMDIRGKGVPGIMYARGTLVDAPFQYNPASRAGDSSNGGTMHPMHRRVKQKDIDLLQLHKLRFKNNKAIVGEFTSMWHPDHADLA